MRKLIIASLALGALALPLTANADIWKKIGKTIDKVDKTMNAVNEVTGVNKTQTSTTTSTNSRTGSQYGAAPGISMQLVEVVRWGDGIRVTITVANDSNEDIDITMDDTSNVNKRNIHRDEYGNEAYGKYGTGNYRFTVPAGQKVKRSYMLYGLNPNIEKIANMDVTGRADYQTRKYELFTYSASDVPVSSVQTSNNDKVKSTLPSVYVNYKGMERNGNDIIVNFSLLNTSNEKYTNYSNLEYLVYDADGNDYNAEIYRGNNTTQSWIKDLEPEIPVMFHLTVKNVPLNVAGFSLIRLPFGKNKEYKIEFKNISL